MVKIFVYSKNKLTFTKFYILTLSWHVPEWICWYCWLFIMHSMKYVCFYSRIKFAVKSCDTPWKSDKNLRFIMHMIYFILLYLFYCISLFNFLFVTETEHTAYAHQSRFLPWVMSLVHRCDFELVLRIEQS